MTDEEIAEALPETPAGSLRTSIRILGGTWNRLVEIGLPAVPYLLSERQNGISFQRFTYCCSACNQILRKGRPRNYVLWYRGAGGDGFTIEPGGQRDVRAFRLEVVADIKMKYKQETTKRKRQSHPTRHGRKAESPSP